MASSRLRKRGNGERRLCTLKWDKPCSLPPLPSSPPSILLSPLLRDCSFFGTGSNSVPWEINLGFWSLAVEKAFEPVDICFSEYLMAACHQSQTLSSLSLCLYLYLARSLYLALSLFLSLLLLFSHKVPIRVLFPSTHRPKVGLTAWILASVAC